MTNRREFLQATAALAASLKLAKSLLAQNHDSKPRLVRTDTPISCPVRDPVQWSLEHVMPRKWNVHWTLSDGPTSEPEREALLHTLGNLTLLTARLNSKVSNGPWEGEAGKRQGLEANDVLLMNRSLVKTSRNSVRVDWTDSTIRSRTDDLTKIILEIWPVPEGHRSNQSSQKTGFRHRIDLSDLLNAGFLKVGDVLHPRRKKHAEQKAVVLSDGRLDIDGNVFASPSEAGKSITGKSTNGWWFFLVDPHDKLSLRQLRSKYLESISAEDDDDDLNDEDDE